MNILKYFFRFILSYNFMKKYSRKVLMFVTNIFFYEKKRLKSFGDFSLYLDLKEYTAWSYFFKKQEKEEEIFLRKVIKGTDNILDIGANLGFYSLLFSSLAPNGKIFSFEPSTTNFEKLSENIELNKRINIKIFKMAISNKIGNSKLYLAGKENLNDGGNFIDENKKNYDFKTIEFENVQTDTLDNFLDKKIPFQLAKIDTEGHEINVLKGMTYLLENNLKFLLIETDTNFNEISLFLDKYNFKVLKKGNLNSIFEKV